MKRHVIIANFQRDTSPVAQEALVHPLQRFDSSRFGADARLDVFAVALTILVHRWLKKLFANDAGLYPSVRPSNAICAGLAAFVARRLCSQTYEFADDWLLQNAIPICDVMYPASSKVLGAVSRLAELESSSRDASEKDIGLKWSRIVSRSIDSFMIDDAGQPITSDDPKVELKRMVVLPSTLPFPGELADAIEVIGAKENPE